MSFALVPPLLVALTTLALVAAGHRLRKGGRKWTPLGWLVLVSGGAVAAAVVRAVETLIIDLVVGGRLASSEGVLPSIFAFGIIGPFTVLTLAAIVWPAVSSEGGSRDDVDPPLAAAAAAAGFGLGRVATLVLLERMALGSGVRAAIGVSCDVALAATWGYGLALSGFDGKLGGSPFGRYALVAMMLRGAVELSLRSKGPFSVAFPVGVGAILLIFATLGVFRLARHATSPPASLASLGQETIREIAKDELARGVRPMWILIGALGNLGGIILGFAGAVAIGWSAKIDFGEIDRAGPGAEYAALLLVLGVVVSFPFSAAVVGMASGGRARAAGSAHVLEAGIAAILALSALLFVLGVVAPVAVALGAAIAPIAFALAGVGAWIAAGRRM